MFENMPAFVRYILKGNIRWDIEGEAETDDNTYKVLCVSSPIKDKLFRIVFDKFLKKVMTQKEFIDGKVGTVLDLKTGVPTEYHSQLINLVGKFDLKPYTILSKELESARIERTKKGWVLYIELKGLFK